MRLYPQRGHLRTGSTAEGDVGVVLLNLGPPEERAGSTQEARRG